jgi:hypothetical protein
MGYTPYQPPSKATLVVGFVLWSAACFVFLLFPVLVSVSRRNDPGPTPEKPPRIVAVCGGCGSEWEQIGPGEPGPITTCPNCPMSEEEFERLKDELRKRIKAREQSGEPTDAH